jgi:hypothetical protein
MTLPGAPGLAESDEEGAPPLELLEGHPVKKRATAITEKKCVREIMTGDRTLSAPQP